MDTRQDKFWYPPNRAWKNDTHRNERVEKAELRCLGQYIHHTVTRTIVWKAQFKFLQGGSGILQKIEELRRIGYWPTELNLPPSLHGRIFWSNDLRGFAEQALMAWKRRGAPVRVPGGEGTLESEGKRIVTEGLQ